MSPARAHLATLFLCACGTWTSQMRHEDATAVVQRGAVVPAFLGTRVYLNAIFWFDPKGWRPDDAPECVDPLVDGRGVCALLGPASEVHDIEGGVSIRFAEGVEPAAIVSHLRCHHLWVGLEGFQEDGGCSLGLAGVRFAARSFELKGTFEALAPAARSERGGLW